MRWVGRACSQMLASFCPFGREAPQTDVYKRQVEGQRSEPIQVLGDAVGVGLENVVGGVVHVAAQLLAVLKEVGGILAAQHHARGKDAVAAAGLRCV